MHDVMFSKAIINAIKEASQKLKNHQKITAVNISLSPLSHVKPETLQETFNTMLKDANLPYIKLNIKPLALVMLCSSCNETFYIEMPTFKCRKCGSHSINLTDSREFLIESTEND